MLVSVSNVAIASPAAAAATTTVTADFAADRGVGHAEVFGSTVNHLDDDAKIDAVHQAGTRFIRRDAYLSEILPQSTVDDYRGNKNGIQDPNTWRWEKYGWVDEYHERGIKILLIMSYNTSWLGYDCGCAFHSPPRDWWVYEDIVKKIYQRFQGKVHMVEVWNEPDLSGFLNLTGSPYAETLADRKRAYRDIYLHAARAIRSVDATIPIGGPVVSNPNFHDWATYLLSPQGDGHDEFVYNNVNFLSFHHYWGHHPQDMVAAWRNVATARGKGADFPLYITEWNWEAGHPAQPDKSSRLPDSISYTGERLTSAYNQRLNGANIYADNDELLEQSFIGVYGNGMLTPRARTFRLLSADLGLGDGDGRIRGISYTSPVTAAGAATNGSGDNVAWVVNDGDAPIEVTLNLTGLGSTTSTVANMFEASANNAAVVSPKSAVRLTVSGGNAAVRLAAPAKSVVGVRLTPYTVADADNLATSATATSSSVTAGAVLPAANIRDGVVGVHATGEWASNGELTPWAQLSWTAPQTVGRIVLYDRANDTDQVRAGKLVFSDGSEVSVPELPNDGTGKSISFPPRATSSVRFQTTIGRGLNVGLSEFQVFRGKNLAREATVSTKSQLNRTTHGHAKAVDGVIGQSRSEWASGETNPWIHLRWPNARTVAEVLLHDRIGGDNANGGTLTFSDGTSVPVTGIPANGTAKSVTFPARSVNWVRFTVSGGSGSNVGLSEIRVMEAANLASSATATPSSVDPAFPTLNGSAVTDGVVNQWGAGEWASNRELTPSIELRWPTPQSVGHVVLYDRSNYGDHVQRGTLRFSDGSTMAVPVLDNTGLGKVVAFAPKSVTWVRFEVNAATGYDVGLSEIEVFPPAQARFTWETSSLQKVVDPAVGFYGYAPAAIDADGTEHYWTCHNGNAFQIKDYIWHTKRVNGVITSERAVLNASASGWDSFHVCDPAVVAAKVTYQATTYNYAMFYLGNDVDASAHNQIGVAFATSLDGPWVKYPQPLVTFPHADPKLWGVGQPAVTAVDSQTGHLLLFYTVGDESTSKGYRREVKLGNMAAPLVGPAVELPTAGLTGSDGSPDHLNNFDIVYDPPTDRFYMVREQHPYPVSNPNYIGENVQISSIPGNSIWTGTGTWVVEGNLTQAVTGSPRNHNAGFVRNVYGMLITSGTVPVAVTSSCAGHANCDPLWTYDLWRINGKVTGP